MVWLFEGYPDRPERLRRWFLDDRLWRRIEKRRLRRGKDPWRDDPVDTARKGVKRTRRRRLIANVVTEPGLTIAAELAGGVLVALQVDRLTDPTRSGSLATAVLGVALVVLGVFASRSRAAYEAKLRDRAEDDIDRRIVENVTGAVEGTGETVVEQLTAELFQLRDALEGRTEQLRTEIQRVRDDLQGR